jgi:hypothetical protein
MRAPLSFVTTETSNATAIVLDKQRQVVVVLVVYCQISFRSHTLNLKREKHWLSTFICAPSFFNK